LIFYTKYLIYTYTSHRDTFIYAASVEAHALDTTVKILGDVVLRPRLAPNEVKKSFKCIIMFHALKIISPMIVD
jgi:predicted Zn-dependent peptidase